ncbi:MAG: hypothetical protein DRG78_03375 [Epsilonproteobacteria bacterium]|nr:MAG: hypothetical protein DRG78_03375 [Campylobacterota bacterium]
MRVLLILLLYASSAFSNVLVITSPLQNQNKLYRFELQSIFTLNNVSWDDGTPIIPIFLQFSSETHKRFITDVLLVNSHSFRRDIESKLIKGNLFNVYVAKTDSEVLDLLDRIDGSIAYINELTVIMADNHEIKIITIID